MLTKQQLPERLRRQEVCFFGVIVFWCYIMLQKYHSLTLYCVHYKQEQKTFVLLAHFSQ